MSAEDKTEEATPRKRQKEREKGNIAKSQDLNSALMLCAAVGLCLVLSHYFLRKLKEIMHFTFTNLPSGDISGDMMISTIRYYMIVFGEIVFPFAIPLFFITIFLLWTQIGNLFSVEKLKPKFDKLSPSTILNNAKKQLNPVELRNVVEFVKSLLKMGCVFAAGYSVIMARRDDLLGLLGASPAAGLSVIGSILVQMVVAICIMMLLIGYIDKKYQVYEYEKAIKMTKKEVKDEYKDSEGNPEVKSKIKGIQLKFARQRMMAAIPEADVIVTNPTHFAVAIKYDKEVSPAPIVVAKGVDYLAFKIREIGENNNIPIVENRPLARSLYKLVPVNGTIPAELYVAVAEVLAWVYNKNRQGVTT